MAPATLLTGLLFYFGWSFTYWYFHYLGVNSTLLSSTTQDYVMRSVDLLFVPVTAVVLAALILLWARAVFAGRLSAASRERVARFSIPVSAVIGSLLGLLAIAAVLSQTLQRNLFLVAPLSLVFGVLLIAYAVHAVRRTPGDPAAPGHDGIDWRPLTEWASVFVLVGIGLFWAVGDYASAVGRLRAEELVRGLQSQPHAVLYSERSLSISGPGIAEVRCSDPDAAYRFRYDGLVLVLQSGGQYLLLPREWTPGPAAALVIPRSDSLRLEFRWDPGPEGVGRC